MHTLAVVDLDCARGDRHLFTDMAWRADSGTVTALRGPNGAGKTTLLRTLAGLCPPAAGRVTWCGGDIRELGPEYRRELAWVGHANALKADLTPAENLEFHRALMSEPALDVASALDRLGVGALADRPCRNLSAGQNRRASLARLLVGGAPVWLLDEPTAGLDADGEGLVDSMIDEHCGRGGIVIIATHRTPVSRATMTEVTLG